MPKLPFTARFCLLISLLTALLLSAGAGTAAAAASGKPHTHKTPKHHVTRARRHGKHTVKKVSTKKRHGHKTHEKKKGVKATAARSAPPAKKKTPTKPAKPTPTVTTPTLTTTPTATTTTTTPTATTSAGSGPVGIPGNWNVVMDSEFTGSSLPSQWATGWFGNGVTGGVGGTSEADCYSPSDVTLPGDGTLHLNLTKTSSSCDGVTQPYTTGLITTDPSDGRSSGGGFTYTYGVAEAKIYVPANGTQLADWPSFWADGTGTWPETGEDDVLEGLGGEACFHFHDPLGGPGSCDTSITPGWHTFASDWQPGSVTYYYDGKDVGSISSGVTSSPMYLILGNGVSSTLSDTVADSMQVAYVRVWQS